MYSIESIIEFIFRLKFQKHKAETFQLNRVSILGVGSLCILYIATSYGRPMLKLACFMRQFIVQAYSYYVPFLL